MRHRANKRFWKHYQALPVEIRRLADKNFELLRADPHHHSLRFKKVGQYWSARVGNRYRAVAVEDGPNLVWFWIGAHDEYERLLRDRWLLGEEPAQMA